MVMISPTRTAALPFSIRRPFNLIWPASAQLNASERLLANRRKNSSLSIRKVCLTF
jgi:hypothetical protein